MKTESIDLKLYIFYSDKLAFPKFSPVQLSKKFGSFHFEIIRLIIKFKLFKTGGVNESQLKM